MNLITLLNNYPGLSRPALQLTRQTPPDPELPNDPESVITKLRECFSTGDEAKVDAALRDVIRAAQQARKILKNGPNPAPVFEFSQRP